MGIYIVNNNKIYHMIKNYALRFDQESSISSEKQFIKGWLLSIDDNILCGGGLFIFNSSYVIDYIFPNITHISEKTLLKLFREILEYLTQNKFFPVFVVRDISDRNFFIDQLGFSEANLTILPNEYYIHTIEKCNKCPDYKGKCNPIVFYKGMMKYG